MHLGIDLGTTNSLGAVFRDGKVELVPNALGHALTPSAVSVQDDGKILVGLAARERLSTAPSHTATAFKRWMGTDRKIRLGQREFLPEELSALVLQSIKLDAEAYLGHPVAEAVITVPAYFNDAQRQATKRAASLAGLKVERLLNEPTAAGIAYGLQERSENSVFLVFDLGGGTFDVSVLEYFDGIVQVRASAGDTRLGGEDFASLLQRMFLSRCENLSKDDIDRILADGQLWRVAEQAKRDLSTQNEATMRLLHGETEIEQVISRAAFEEASAELISRLRRPIERALNDARLEPGELSEVILVGGATRMPLVRQTVARLFQRLPLRTINPDETIAHGAAIQAALLSRDAALDDIVLTDVMPFSLGIITAEDIGSRRLNDKFSPIIERNSPVPLSRVETYSTIEDQQRKINIDIRQGESPVGSENLKLGELEIDVPPLPAGHATIEVRFSYDASGVLEVDVLSSGNGKKASTVIRQSGHALSEEQLAAAHDRLQSLKTHPRDQQQNQYLIERAKRLYEDLLGEDRAIVQHWLSRFELILNSQDEAVIAPAREDLRDKLNQFDTGFIL